MTTGLLALPNAAADPGPDPRPRSGAVALSEPSVRLRADPGSPVRAAEVPVTRGQVRTASYSMLGLTWRGADPVRLRVRTQGPDGWSAWQTPAVLEDGPTAGTEVAPQSSRAASRAASRTASPKRATHPLWVGPSYGVQVDARGVGHRDLTLVLIDPGALPADATAARVPATPAPSARTSARRATPKRSPRPPLLTRAAWGANPALLNGSPTYNTQLRQVHLHHTASGNDYTAAEVPAILRGMYRYHTASLGWFDLGYNFVVDKFGRTWAGRSGGAARLVRGAHTLGFNHNSTGIAVLGNFEETWPTRKAVTAIVRLASWKLDLKGRAAAGRVLVRSEGSDRFAAGRFVRLPVVDGHRDTNETACPGERLYDLLPRIRKRTQARIAYFDPR